VLRRPGDQLSPAIVHRLELPHVRVHRFTSCYRFQGSYFLYSFLSSHFLLSYIHRVTPAPDAVDAIEDQWRLERPDLDSSPMSVIGRISRLAALLERELDDVFARYGLAGCDFDVLATLRRSGAPYRLTPTELSRSTMVTTGGMTKRLDRLETSGLIRREADPRDRRGKLIVLTDEGRELIDRAVEGHLENEERLLSSLSRSEREQLAGLLRGMLLAVDR
jgi:DNA-binding MarR family transcriptional regulator